MANLLAHLQRLPVSEALADDSSEDDQPLLQVQNTFIHFKVPRQVLARHQTEPSPQVKDSTTAKPPEPEKPKEETPSTQAPSAAWLVDGRRLKGRDTRISSPLRPLVGGGPDCLDIVMTIFPLCKSTKRGGACFKAAEGVGHIQLKCNNPIDKDLSVCITIGSKEQRCQRHNFADNALMQFIGDWNFMNFIDSRVDRPTVAVTLQLFPPDEMATGMKGFAANATVAAAISDPAIAAFSLSKTAAVAHSGSVPLSAKPYPQPPVLPLQATQAKVVFGDFCEDDPAAGYECSTAAGYECSTTPSSTPQLSPEVTPRTPPPSLPAFSPTPAQFQTPPPSPFFSYGGSLLFSFTIRRADGVLLGLDVDPDATAQELLVLKVIPGGAAESWNRQCFAGPFSSKAIVPTDRIVGINGRSNVAGMLEECRHNQLLKLFVVRGDLAHADIPQGWCGAASPSPTIQFVAVPVPVLYPVPCVKHGIMVCESGPMATYLDQSGPFCTFNGYLRATACEFVPAAEQSAVTEHNADSNATATGSVDENS